MSALCRLSDESVRSVRLLLCALNGRIGLEFLNFCFVPLADFCPPLGRDRDLTGFAGLSRFYERPRGTAQWG
jgi:hypothetical protein